VLALVFAHAYARAFYGGIVLVIEEPEAHFHPLAQEWLGRKIRDMTRDGLQIILTTHSSMDALYGSACDGVDQTYV
jgi:putative ATP-dependent endonuclease of the OLD family